MRTTKYSILVSYAKIIEKYGRNYAYPKTSTMLDLLHKFTGLRISARAYYKHTADLRKDGLIKSYRRYGRLEDGTIYRRTSHVYLTIKGYAELARRGWKWALSMAKKLRKKFVPEKQESKPEIIMCNKAEEKKETDTLKETINKVRQEGGRLYDYLLNKGLKRMPLNNGIQAAANET